MKLFKKNLLSERREKQIAYGIILVVVMGIWIIGLWFWSLGSVHIYVCGVAFGMAIFPILEWIGRMLKKVLKKE